MNTANDQALKKMRELPAPQSCRLIDFDKAEVRPGFVDGTFFLIVNGNAPCFNMRVQLMPLIYIQRPEYWEIEVVGCQAGPVCLPAVKPYTETLPLDGILGTKGIEVVGASRRVKIEVKVGAPVYGEPAMSR